jgi:hypothetical protein
VVVLPGIRFDAAAIDLQIAEGFSAAGEPARPEALVAVGIAPQVGRGGLRPAQVVTVGIVFSPPRVQFDGRAVVSVHAIDERLCRQSSALRTGHGRERARQRARRERLRDARSGIEPAEPVAEQVFSQQRFGGDGRLRMRNGPLKLQKSGGKLERQVDAIALAGRHRDAGECRFQPTATVHRARHMADRLRRAVVEEQPSRQFRRAGDDLVDQRPQMMLAFGGDDQTMPGASAGAELPHQARVDALQMLLHPAGKVPIELVVEEALEILGLGAECIPPGFDPRHDGLACMLLFRAFTGCKEFPPHRR